MLKIIPLGGLGEIGLNMMVFDYGDTLFVVDAGLMFPEDYMLGVDFVIPDMDYLRQNQSRVAGIVLTHAHEDHIGALPYLLKDLKAPVFGTTFTLGLVRQKLEEYDRLGSTALHSILPEEKLKLGPFTLEFIRVGHSVIDGVGIAIQTPVGRIIHTGDFKIGYGSVDGMATDVNKFAKFGEEGVLVLLSDSTNVEREGYPISDKEICETLMRVTTGSSGRVIVALFASNIARIQVILDIAKANGKKIIFAGKSIEDSVRIARQLGYLDTTDSKIISIDEVADYDDEEITATTYTEEREYKKGTSWCKWLSLFIRPKVVRALDISFSAEVGPRKGSWKGGTVGHGIDMLPGENHESAFRRYCKKGYKARDNKTYPLTFIKKEK